MQNALPVLSAVPSKITPYSKQFFGTGIDYIRWSYNG